MVECFLIELNEVEGRLDPWYYKPWFKLEFEKLFKSKYKIVTLKDICTKITDGTHYTPKYKTSGVPFISVKDVRENKIDFSHTKFISEEEHFKFIKRCKPEPDDILLTKIGTTGLSAVIPPEAPEFSIFVSVALLKINKSKANPKYISIFLNSLYTRFQIDRVLKGIGVPDLHLENIAEIKIPIPTFEIQNKIIEIMENAYILKKEKNLKSKKLMDTLNNYIFNDLNIKLPKKHEKMTFKVYRNEIEGRIDSNYYKPFYMDLVKELNDFKYPIIKLEDIIKDLSGGSTPKVDGDYYTTKGKGIPFLRVQNITKKGLMLENVKYIKKDVHETKLKRSQLRENDIVFTITGRIGHAVVIPKGFIGNINQHSVRFSLKNKINTFKIDPHYVTAYLNSENGNLLSCRGITGGTRPALDYKVLKNIEIPIPPLELQEKIASEYKSRIEKIDELEKEAYRIIEHSKSIIEEILVGD